MPKTTIALTGRRNLPQSAFNFDWENIGNGATCIFEILDREVVKDLPRNSRVRILMAENKNVHLADFGTLDDLKTSISLPGVVLSDIKPELRIVSTQTETDGLLLASTKLPKSDKTGSADGILHFQPKDTTPLLWELYISETDFPVLFLSEEIEDCVSWVQSDPVFLTTVFPVVIEKVFTQIFRSEGGLEEGWMYQWILWSQQMGCEKFPVSGDEEDFQTQWLEPSISTILAKMDLLKGALQRLNEKVEN